MGGRLGVSQVVVTTFLSDLSVESFMLAGGSLEKKFIKGL